MTITILSLFSNTEIQTSRAPLNSTLQTICNTWAVWETSIICATANLHQLQLYSKQTCTEVEKRWVMTTSSGVRGAGRHGALHIISGAGLRQEVATYVTLHQTWAQRRAWQNSESQTERLLPPTQDITFVCSVWDRMIKVKPKHSH